MRSFRTIRVKASIAPGSDACRSSASSACFGSTGSQGDGGKDLYLSTRRKQVNGQDIITDGKIHQNGRAVFKWAVNTIAGQMNTLPAQCGLTMSDIAERLGFASPSAFGAAFRRAAGLSPLQYSRTVRGA